MKFLKKVRFEIDNLNIRVADKLIDRREWKRYNPEHRDLLDSFETLGFIIKLEDAIIERRHKIKQYREYLILQKIKKQLSEEEQNELKRSVLSELKNRKFKDM